MRSRCTRCTRQPATAVSDDAARCSSLATLTSPLPLHCSRYLVSTWLWGSLATRYKQFDRTADNFSLSFCFLEVRVAGVELSPAMLC